jgi:acetylornithine and succinylornithine aminotransferases
MGEYLFPNYARKPFEIISGNGVYLTDNAGKNYLDFTSGIGVVNLGYNHPTLNQVLAEQAQTLWHTPNLYQNHLQEEVAEKLANGHEYVSFFCNSGAEANEAAIKLARKATGKTQIISCVNSFHGRTYGSMSATGQASIHAGFEPLVPDFDYMVFNDTASAKEKITSQTAAVMIEVIQGEGGVVVADSDWLTEVVALCQQYDALLIVDEVQTGIGRTGSLFAFEQFGIEPDIFTLAKGLGNGFPVGAMVGKKELAEHFGPGSHGSTFGGNKLGMAVANEVLTLLPAVLAELPEKSSQLLTGLQAIDSDKVVAVRGQGMMIGIELALEVSVADVLVKLEEAGLLALRAGANVLRLLPPLTMDATDLQKGIDIIKEILEK